MCERAPCETALQLPAGTALDLAFCQQLAAALDTASRLLPASLPQTLPAAACLGLLRRAEKLLRAEPTLLHVHPPAGAEVAVVGDLHGQFHDLLTLFATAGYPSPSRLFVFNGDFVDRGAWGLETLLLLAALKVAAPRGVVLVRGNHESLYCSWVYGFRAEVMAKYGAESEKQGEAVFSACRSLFSHLPLAAVVAETTLVLHGGLPRAPPRRTTRRSAAAADDAGVTIAALADIAAASKGGDDPDPGQPGQRLAADVLWSDPCEEPGVRLGARPGDVGIQFGPDVTEAFLRENQLRLILRSHEGPDARALRPDMSDMLQGYTLDHDTPCGKLYTVFSAPQYPQFGEPGHDNLGAVAVLAEPGYDAPRFLQFSAAPRPPASPYVAASESAEVEAGPAEAVSGSPARTVQVPAAQVEATDGRHGGNDGGGSGGSSGDEEGVEAAGARAGDVPHLVQGVQLESDSQQQQQQDVHSSKERRETEEAVCMASSEHAAQAVGSAGSEEGSPTAVAIPEAGDAEVAETAAAREEAMAAATAGAAARIAKLEADSGEPSGQQGPKRQRVAA